MTSSQYDVTSPKVGTSCVEMPLYDVKSRRRTLAATETA